MIPLMRRLAALLTLLALFAAAPVAVAQTNQGGGGGAFGPLPEPAPEQTPVPTVAPTTEEQSDTDRTLLFAIGGGLLALFLVIGYVIIRVDLALTGSYGQGGRRLEEASAVRPEPPRTAALL